jgi:hypothetical protein
MPAGAPPIQIKQKKSGLGCFGCGCAILVAIVALFIVLAIVGSRVVYSWGQSYTSPTPVTVPITDRGDAVYSSARQKIDAFGDAFERMQPATLHLSSDEINTLIARDPAYADLRGHLHVTLQNDQAVVDSSNLIGDLGKTALGPKGSNVPLADRYLNAQSTGTIGFESTTHTVSFSLTTVQANGQTMSATTCAVLNIYFNLFLNQALQKDQVARDFLARVQKADIENGELVLEIK